MKLFFLISLTATASAFAFEPSTHMVRPSTTMYRPPQHQVRGGDLELKNALDDTAESCVSTTEKYVGKADDLVLNRAMRVVDHAPAFVTLKALADAAGVDLGLTPAAIMALVSGGANADCGLATALSIPAFMMSTVAKAYILFQALSLAKSALASDENELSQSDITAATATNFVAARAIGSANPLRDTIITALVSGFAIRNGSASGDPSIHNIAPQLLSSFATVVAVLGLVNSVAAKIPILSDCASAISLLGIGAYYAMVTRGGNSTVKKAVNAGVLGGMLVNSLKDGVSFSLSLGSLMTNVVLAGTAYLAYRAVDSLRSAVFDDSE